MVGGMLPQRPDALDVIARAQGRGRIVVAGGPDAMSSPEAYSAAEFLVLGEAEAALAPFVQAWESGARRGVFTAAKGSADMSSSPIPRFDLIDFSDYLY